MEQQSLFHGIISKPKKQKKPPPKHWRLLIDVWINFYKGKFNLTPTMRALDCGKLKEIIISLEAGAVGVGWEWNEQTATNTLTMFLDAAYSDHWLQRNFLLKNLHSQYDKIIANGQKAGIGGNTNQRPHQSEILREQLAAGLKRKMGQ